MKQQLTNLWNKSKNVIFLIIYLIIFYILYEYFGWLGVIISAILFALYRCWIAREHLIIAIKYIETILWGKPLDKELWTKEELKKTKIRWKQ